MKRLKYFWHRILRRPHRLAKPIDVGKGQPVVFLHGIGASAENWRPVVGALDSTKYRTVALDLLGFGKSPQPDWSQYTVDDHAASVISTLKQLKLLKRPVILVGHSMGSLVAARIARQHPELVKHLILYQMPVYDPNPNDSKRDFAGKAYLSFYKWLAANPKRTLRYTGLLGKVAADGVLFSLDEQNWLPFEKSLLNTIIPQKSYEDLQNLIVPTDVIYGRYDFFVLRKYLKKSFKPSPQVQFYELKEQHRITSRTAELIRDLVIQDPDQPEKLSTKYARLIDMKKLKAEPVTEPVPPKRAARLIPRQSPWLLGTAIFVLAVTTILAWQGNLPNFERQIFDAVNGASSNDSMLWLARIMSDTVWAAVGLISLVFIFSKRIRWDAWQVGVTATLTYVFVYSYEHIVGRARPNELITNETVIRAVQSGMGFPSGHLAVATAIILVLWPRLNKWLRGLAVVYIVVSMWARVYLGVHFPLDVIAGVAAGIIVSGALRYLPPHLKSRLRFKTL